MPHQFQSYNVKRELELLSQEQSYRPMAQKFGKDGAWTAKASGAQSTEKMFKLSNKSNHDRSKSPPVPVNGEDNHVILEKVRTDTNKMKPPIGSHKGSSYINHVKLLAYLSGRST